MKFEYNPENPCERGYAYQFAKVKASELIKDKTSKEREQISGYKDDVKNAFEELLEGNFTSDEVKKIRTEAEAEIIQLRAKAKAKTTDERKVQKTFSRAEKAVRKVISEYVPPATEVHREEQNILKKEDEEAARNREAKKQENAKKGKKQ